MLSSCLSPQTIIPWMDILFAIIRLDSGTETTSRRILPGWWFFIWRQGGADEIIQEAIDLNPV